VQIKNLPNGRFFVSAPSVDGAFDSFFVDFRKAKIKKGISHPAGCDSGRCPENPQTFEKV